MKARTVMQFSNIIKYAFIHALSHMVMCLTIYQIINDMHSYSVRDYYLAIGGYYSAIGGYYSAISGYYSAIGISMYSKS